MGSKSTVFMSNLLIIIIISDSSGGGSSSCTKTPSTLPVSCSCTLSVFLNIALSAQLVEEEGT